MKQLTIKEERFANLCIELGNQNEAYRQAYDVTTTNLNTISPKASKLVRKYNISTRVKELRNELIINNKLTKQHIIEHHLKMVYAWGELWELGKKKGKDKEEIQRFYLLKEMVKGSDYRGALDSISKMLGFNEPEKVEHSLKTIEIIERKRE